MRGWALAEPHRYLLIYGTPVPGYHAPQEATVAAASMMAILLDAFSEPGQSPAGAGAADEADASGAFDRHLATHRQWAAGHPAPEAAMRRALTFWTRLHGVVSLEVAGHFAGMGFDPALLYAAEVQAAVGA
jgi:hypothetical protein